MCGCADVWMRGCMDAWMRGCVDGWVDGWMGGWVEGWMDGLLRGMKALVRVLGEMRGEFGIVHPETGAHHGISLRTISSAASSGVIAVVSIRISGSTGGS